MDAVEVLPVDLAPWLLKGTQVPFKTLLGLRALDRRAAAWMRWRSCRWTWRRVT